ncbi:hypothetical protein [Nocardia exalbida]|uniref:hypothetical protein n=1 Tax=Nocardia exalbida TaxID=290231 RepID=UPI001FE130F5|nr:hypothetical protein [Nocardia exalbida]
MTDEAAGMGAGENDRVDVGVRVGPVDEFVEMISDVIAEQPEWSTIDMDQQR